MERDFASEGFDARDWLRGLKPWDQFLNYATKHANTEGSYLQAAQALDDRNLARWEQLIEEADRSTEPHRPALETFDGLRSEIRGLRNDIRCKLGMPELSGPEGPRERIAGRKKTLGQRRLDHLLGTN